MYLEIEVHLDSRYHLGPLHVGNKVIADVLYSAHYTGKALVCLNHVW